MDKIPDTIDPRDASRAYLDGEFNRIEQRLEDGEIDVREAELDRTEAYEWALHNIGIPRYDDGE